MDPRDDWEHEEPPADFADRVMERVRAGDATVKAKARPGRLFAGIVGGLALAAALALAIGLRGGGAAEQGDAIAADRTQVALGTRAVAVLERGSHVSWKGSDVSQSAGDVFYRVEPGRAYRVHTAAGDVAVLGTCFRVKVEDDVKGRDLKSGAIGAALSAVAFVSVYEGKVALSHAGESVTLTAGETARADATGVRRGGAAEEEASNGASAKGGSDPLVAANANLADSVREYKRRLEAIEGQKAAIARQLVDAQQKLAVAENDGQAIVAKNAYDLDQGDWKELAKQGKVVARMPCGTPDSWSLDPKQLNKMGLAPEDAQPIHDALQRSAGRIWATVRPLCIQALQGDAQTADKLGASTCQALVGDVAQQHEKTDEETRAVAEIRAGLRPMPTDPSVLGSYGKMLYAMSGESKVLEKDLAQSIGPDEAHRFTFGEEGNWCQSAWGAGPRPELPPK